jgi:DNA (cytosine-5)-methyltransferase 1
MRGPYYFAERNPCHDGTPLRLPRLHKAPAPVGAFVQAASVVAGVAERLRLLDLYCGQGGAGAGYARAGFEVRGVDLARQPRYPFEFFYSDAIAYARRYWPLFDVIHASPPCQAHSEAWRLRRNDHPELIAPTRDALLATGKPYIIENVPGAPLRNPVVLCGAMFGLRTYRHRLFEANWPLCAPEHPPHTAPQAKMGRPVKPGEFGQFIGNYSGAALAREVMQMPWANRDGIREAIPPAYTEHIGRQLLEHLR